MLPEKNDRENGTILLWTIGVFSVSLLVLSALISLASYFSQSMSLQEELELSATNASDQLNFDSFYLSGEPEDIVFLESALLQNIGKDLRDIEREFGSYKILNWRVEPKEFWLKISHPWHSPIGDFSLLPKDVKASVHVKLDSDRQLQ